MTPLTPLLANVGPRTTAQSPFLLALWWFCYTLLHAALALHIDEHCPHTGSAVPGASHGMSRRQESGLSPSKLPGQPNSGPVGDFAPGRAPSGQDCHPNNFSESGTYHHPLQGSIARGPQRRSCTHYLAIVPCHSVLAQKGCMIRMLAPPRHKHGPPHTSSATGGLRHHVPIHRRGNIGFYLVAGHPFGWSLPRCVGRHQFCTLPQMELQMELQSCMLVVVSAACPLNPLLPLTIVTIVPVQVQVTHAPTK